MELSFLNKSLFKCNPINFFQSIFSHKFFTSFFIDEVIRRPVKNLLHLNASILGEGERERGREGGERERDSRLDANNG